MVCFSVHGFESTINDRIGKKSKEKNGRKIRKRYSKAVKVGEAKLQSENLPINGASQVKENER
ncbi:MAG: hypothetical protein JWQ40_356 [Segetibacter sp.]|nr:hypothetical protein [Segetibacter sp.]